MGNKKSYGIIYVLTSPSGKQYVGQTVKTLKHRLNKHRSLAEGNFQNSAIASAIRKYGIENFKSEEIDEAYCQDELNELEVKYIQELSTLAPNGYNLLTGGANRIHHEETRKKLSEAAKGRRCPEERKKWLSERYSGENNPFYGKQHTEETKRKMRSHKRTEEHARKLGEAKKGSKTPQETKDKIRESVIRFHDNKGRSPVKHGTYAGYRKGCKCRSCLNANAVYHRERYKKIQKG